MQLTLFLSVTKAVFLQVVAVSQCAVERLCDKLERRRGTGCAVDMSDEFRLLTLQVIGEAILSLPPEECDRVRPSGLT